MPRNSSSSGLRSSNFVPTFLAKRQRTSLAAVYSSSFRSLRSFGPRANRQSRANWSSAARAWVTRSWVFPYLSPFPTFPFIELPLCAFTFSAMANNI